MPLSPDQEVIAFAAIAALLTMTPGPDTMLVIRNTVARGRRAGFLTTCGICCGLFIHATLSAVGLSLILLRSATAFEVVKWLGAGYLLWLGLQSFWRALRGGYEPVGTELGAKRAASGRASWVEGLLCNALNPKVAVFYLAFLPQFMRPGDWIFGRSMLLAAIHGVEGMLWLSIVTLCFSWFRAWISQRRIGPAIDATAGAVLIGFGARLALERR
jgi:RhtB (resistance to homoserine/threonine) family protein